MKIQLSELSNYLNDSKGLNEEITGIFKDTNIALNDICENLKSETLTGATQKLTEDINSVQNKIATILPQLSEFLQQQINAYDTTTMESKKVIDSLSANITNNLNRGNTDR